MAQVGAVPALGVTQTRRAGTIRRRRCRSGDRGRSTRFRRADCRRRSNRAGRRAPSHQPDSIRSGPSFSTHGCASSRWPSGCGSGEQPHRPRRNGQGRPRLSPVSCAAGGAPATAVPGPAFPRPLGAMLGVRARPASPRPRPAARAAGRASGTVDASASSPGRSPRLRPASGAVSSLASAIATDRRRQRDARESLAQHGDEMRGLARRRGQREAHGGGAGVPARIADMALVRERERQRDDAEPAPSEPAGELVDEPVAPRTRAPRRSSTARRQLEPALVARRRHERRPRIGDEPLRAVERGDEIRADAARERRRAAARAASPKVVMPAAASVASAAASRSRCARRSEAAGASASATAPRGHRERYRRAARVSARANSSAAVGVGREREPRGVAEIVHAAREHAPPSRGRPPKRRRLPPISASTASGGARLTVGVNCVAHVATAASAAASALGSRSRSTRSGASASAAETSWPARTPASARGGVGGDDARVVAAGASPRTAARRRPAPAPARRRRAAARAGAGRSRAWRSRERRHSRRLRVGGVAASQIRFRQPELGKLRRAQVRLVRAEELVELRRLDRGAGEHRVRLPAMMDLVLEQMREEARRAFRSRCRRGAARGTGSTSRASVKRGAGVDQAAVDCALRGCELGARREGLLRIEKALARRCWAPRRASARSSAST